MQNRNELCRSFAKQKPFIYKVGVEYFAIGYRVLRKCTNDEIELAKKYEAEWERLFQIIGLDLEEIDLSIVQPFKVKELGEITRKILGKALSIPETDESTGKTNKSKLEMEQSDQSADCLRREFCGFFETATDQILEDLERQARRMIRASEFDDLCSFMNKTSTP